jgi:hypothetical protein
MSNGSIEIYVSYGLLLLVALASRYFSRGLDPRDITHKPAERINHHWPGQGRLRNELEDREQCNRDGNARKF